MPTSPRRIGQTSKSWRERGASAVEFALIVPVLLLLVVGISEFGRAYYIQTSLTNSSREGARAAALTINGATTIDSAAKTAAKSASTLNPVPADADIVVGQALGAVTAPNTGPCQPGYTVTVTTTNTMTFLTVLLGTGSSIKITGKASMRCGG